MKNIKNNLLLIFVLALAIVLCAPTIIKAEDNGQNQNGRDNGNRINDDLEDENEDSLDLTTSPGDDSIMDNDDNNDDDKVELSGQEHRSRVANFVKSLSDIANRDGGMVGSAVRDVAKEQEDNRDTVADAIDKIKNRSAFKTFFIGTDYKNVGQLRSETVRTENQIKRLETLLETTSDAIIKADLQTQIDALKSRETKISDFIKTNENKFSLFGWFVKIFNR